MAISITLKPHRGAPPKGFPPGTRSYRVTLHKGNKRISTPFHQGPAIHDEPDAARVLESLAVDASCGDQSFEGYCSDFGCDPDSREQHRIWKACRRIVPKLKNFLGSDYETVISDPERIPEIVRHRETRHSRSR